MCAAETFNFTDLPESNHDVQQDCQSRLLSSRKIRKRRAILESASETVLSVSRELQETTYGVAQLVRLGQRLTVFGHTAK